MPNAQELREKLWNSLSSDGVVMLGLTGGQESHKRPMAARIHDGDDSAVWFFSDNTTALAKALSSGGAAAEACYAARGHDFFACAHGKLTIDNDPVVINALWNGAIAAWYPGGKADPRLTLLRFDPMEAEIWEADAGLVASAKAQFGADPSAEQMRGDHATVAL